MSGTLGMFGDMKQASTSRVFPRLPRTHEEQTAQAVWDPAPVATAPTGVIVARGRDEMRDPCVPTVPVTFSTRLAVMC
jgi:hypothetical protein